MKNLHKTLVVSLYLLVNYTMYSQECESLIPNYQNDENSTTNSSTFDLSNGTRGATVTTHENISGQLFHSGWQQLDTSGDNYANIISTPWEGNIKIINNSSFHLYKGIDRGYLISPDIEPDTYDSPLSLPVVHSGFTTGTMLGAKTGGGIHKEINFPNAGTYYLFFSQLNATKLNGSGPITSSRWAVTIAGDTRESIFMPASNDIIDNTGNWKRAFLKFNIPNPGPYDVEFKVKNIVSSFNEELYIDNYLLLDNIELYAEADCNAPDRVTQRNSSSFKPNTGDYILSAWVKETSNNQLTYTSGVEVSFTINGAITTLPLFSPKGNIIDGWQRIEEEFDIPQNATDISITLKNNTTTAYFDDIRIHKADGTMKSFVYDPVTQRLMAELDENNYATLYEYDHEGGLVRVKKETEKGIYTIQETRSSNVKLNN